MHTITRVQYVCMNHFLCVIFTHLYLPQIPQNINTGSSTAKVLDNWNYCIYEKKSLSLSICFERENEILYKSNFPSMPQFCICTIKHQKKSNRWKVNKETGDAKWLYLQSDNYSIMYSRKIAYCWPDCKDLTARFAISGWQIEHNNVCKLACDNS